MGVICVGWDTCPPHRLPFELVGALCSPTACFAFEGWCGLGGSAGCVLSGTLMFGPCGKLIFGVYYSVAVEPCAVVVSNDIHEQFPV